MSMLSTLLGRGAARSFPSILSPDARRTLQIGTLEVLGGAAEALGERIGQDGARAILNAATSPTLDRAQRMSTPEGRAEWSMLHNSGTF